MIIIILTGILTSKKIQVLVELIITTCEEFSDSAHLHHMRILLYV